MAEQAQYRGTGKRKTSVARVILRPGDGTTWFNGRDIATYFPRATHQMMVLAPLKVAGLEGQYDLRVRVHGGGPSGQAGAVRHGIARALVEANPSPPASDPSSYAASVVTGGGVGRASRIAPGTRAANAAPNARA